MEIIFDTIYNWTKGLYTHGDSNPLDYYLYCDHGYLYIGIVMVIVSFVVSFLYYYLLKPVRKQTAQWFIFYGITAVINFIVSISYAMTPLVNNVVPEGYEEWSNMDCIMFGVADVLWAFVFYVVAALILKWWSINKYVPFQKF